MNAIPIDKNSLTAVAMHNFASISYAGGGTLYAAVNAHRVSPNDLLMVWRTISGIWCGRVNVTIDRYAE